MGAIFRTEREKCRFCQKSLILDGKSNVVVVHHSEFGTYLGCRISKRCKSCKVFELYGYYSLEGMRHMDDNVLKNEFLLSTECNAIQVLLLKQTVPIRGAVPLSPFANSYNRRFDYLLLRVIYCLMKIKMFILFLSQNGVFSGYPF